MGLRVKTIQCPVWALEACSIQKAGLLPWPPAAHLRLDRSGGHSLLLKYISLLPQFFPLTFSKLQEVLFWPGSRRQYVHGEEMLQSALVFQHALPYVLHCRGAAGAPEQWKWILSHLASRRCHTRVSSDWQLRG